MKLAGSANHRNAEHLTLLDGMHLIDAYFSAIGLPKKLIVSSSGHANAEIARFLSRPEAESVDMVHMSDALFRAISPVQTPTGILALVSVPSPAEIGVCMHERFYVLLEAIQDPGNVGSILRSAAAAGATDVYLSEGCADAWSPKTLRAAMGAHFRVRIHEQSDLGDIARSFEGRIIATALHAERNLYQISLTGPTAFLFGNEGAGLSDPLLEAATERVSIPMPGRMESLNAAAAAAVCVFEKVRQEKAMQARQMTAG